MARVRTKYSLWSYLGTCLIKQLIPRFLFARRLWGRRARIHCGRLQAVVRAGGGLTVHEFLRKVLKDTVVGTEIVWWGCESDDYQYRLQ